MACFPVSPRYGKMLSLAHQHNLLPYVVALVAALSVQELFVGVDKPTEEEEEVPEIIFYLYHHFMVLVCLET